ncbi:MAG TPA: Uma2 family endonuclease [Candidatus Xenobia bacterium]|jgi:Uma2 family endonuclease
MQAVDDLYTIEDLERLRLVEEYELDRGVLVPVSQGKPVHGRVVGQIFGELFVFLKTRPDLGCLYAADTGFILERQPDTLRGADVAFVRHDRLVGVSEDEWMEGSPDLAVEVLSGGDRPGQVKKKVRQYLASGSRLVWVLEPRRQRIHIYRPDGIVQVLRGGDTLDGDNVLPGFRLAVADVFR